MCSSDLDAETVCGENGFPDAPHELGVVGDEDHLLPDGFSGAVSYLGFRARRNLRRRVRAVTIVHVSIRSDPRGEYSTAHATIRPHRRRFRP